METTDDTNDKCDECSMLRYRLICSDSAARGLDVSDVTRVIIYDVPTNIKTYIHRVGRTARAGKEGHAYTLLIKQEVSAIDGFRKFINSREKTFLRNVIYWTIQA